ncbi:MAG: hypothetical protein ABFR75_00925 [Acidobacteriota bacterium]
MKRSISVSAIFVFALVMIFVTGCEDNKAGGISSDSGTLALYKMIPENATGFFAINVKKLTSLSVFDKMTKDLERDEIRKKMDMFENYQDFVNKTGIDPKKDIGGAVFVFFNEMDSKNQDFSILANISVNKEKILPIIKEKSKESSEQEYKGLTIYTFKEDKGKEGGLVFMSDNIAAAGTITGLKKIVDLSKGSGENIYSNKRMIDYMEKAGTSSIMSFVFDFPQKMKGKTGNGMFSADLSKAEALYGNVNYEGNSWTGNVILVSHNDEGNKQLATTINSFKGLGAMAGPEVAELVNNIDISSTAESLKLSFTISSDLLEKLKTKAEQKVKSYGTKPPPPPPGEH